MPLFLKFLVSYLPHILGLALVVGGLWYTYSEGRQAGKVACAQYYEGLAAQAKIDLAKQTDTVVKQDVRIVRERIRDTKAEDALRAQLQIERERLSNATPAPVACDLSPERLRIINAAYGVDTDSRVNVERMPEATGSERKDSK
jgi:hypothetical protein